MFLAFTHPYTPSHTKVTGGAVELVLARNGLIFVGASAVVNAGNIAKDDTGCCSSALSRLLREYICRISNTGPSVRTIILINKSTYHLGNEREVGTLGF